MTFDHREFLQFAKDVESRVPTPPEGLLRSAVSRAYYFAFLESREQSLKRGVFKKPKRIIHHAQLIQALRQTNNQTMVRLSHKLATFKVERETADYELAIEVKLPQVQGALTYASDIDSLWQSI